MQAQTSLPTKKSLSSLKKIAQFGANSGVYSDVRQAMDELRGVCGSEVYAKMMGLDACNKHEQQQEEKCGEINQSSYLKIANFYVDFDLIRKVENDKGNKMVRGYGRKVVQSWMDKAGFDLRMYGSAVEMALNLVTYKGFTGSHEFFGLNPGEPYNYLTRTFKNEKDEKFICKQDMLVKIQMAFPKCIEDGHSDDFEGLMKSLNVLIVKNASEKLGYSWEAVCIQDEEQIKGLFTDYVNLFSPSANKNKLPEVKFDPPSDRLELFEEYYFKELRNMIPGEWKNEDFDRMRFFLKRLLRDQPPKENMEYYHRVLWLAKVYVDATLTFIEEHPKYFCLDSEVQTDSQPVVSVRLFVDGSLTFTILDDLLHLDGMKFDSLTPFLFAISYEEATSERVKYQFFSYEVPRATHRAVPIRSLTGVYCILAEDALIEFLRPVFFQLKLFQRLKKEEWPIVEKYFMEKVVPLFNLDCEETEPQLKQLYLKSVKHFIRLDAMEELKRQTYEHFSKIAKRPAKEVRNVRKDGFTIENLKNELKHLELLNVFPDILDFAALAHERVVALQLYPVLRTCDMFEAVENCQTAALLQRITPLGDFACKEKACMRIFHPCNPKEGPSNADDITQSTVNNKIDSETPADTSETSKIHPTDQPSELKIKSSKKKKKEEKMSIPPPFKSIGINTEESGHCKKCFRASQLCDEAKKELKLSQNQVEKLSKKLREAERNAEGSDAKHAKLREKVEEEWKKKYKELEKKYKEEMNEMRAALNKKEMVAVELRRELENQKLATKMKEKTQRSETQEPRIEVPPPVRTVQSIMNRSELSREMKGILFGMQSTRNRLLKENTAQEASKRAHTLIFKSADSNEKRKAQTELMKFNDRYQKYMKTLEENIKKIQSNFNITSSEISKLPEFPKFSDEFEKAFKRIVNEAEHSRTPEYSITKSATSGEAEDEECVVCLHEMTSDGQTVKCPHCERRYHTSCVLKWLQKKTACPTCDRTLLDSQGFPIFF